MGLKKIDSKTGKPIPETRLQATYRKASQRSNERQKQAIKKFHKALKTGRDAGAGSKRSLEAISEMKEAKAEFTQAKKDRSKDKKLALEYGEDAPKAKGFGTYRGIPKKRAKKTGLASWFGINERKVGGQVARSKKDPFAKSKNVKDPFARSKKDPFAKSKKKPSDKPVSKRKKGGKVWSGNDFVREANNYKEI